MRRRIHAYAAADPVFHVCIGDKNRLNHYSKLNHVAADPVFHVCIGNYCL